MKKSLRHFFLSSVALGLALLLLPRPSLALEEDPGLLRSLGVDSPNIENAYYLEGTIDNNTSPRRWIYLYGEGLFVLGKDWGLEADFPVLDTQEPLGQVPAILGPIGANLRYVFYHFGSWSSETAGAFSAQAGGAYGFSNSTFPRIGSSWSLEVLGGFRAGRLFLQGNYGYQGGIDPQVADKWTANTGLGYHLAADWYLQGEVDLEAFPGRANGSSWTFVPQIAFQPGEWLFEFGESFSDSPSAVTEVLVARTF